MPQRWVGSARILQAVFTVFGVTLVSVLVFMLWLRATSGWFNLPPVVIVALSLLLVAGIGLTAYATAHFRQVVVTIDDQTLTIRRAGRDRSIAWPDVQYAAYEQGGGSGYTTHAPGLQIQPRQSFFDDPAHGIPGIKSSLQWTLNGMMFNAKQMDEILNAVKAHVEAASGQYAMLPYGLPRLPDEFIIPDFAALLCPELIQMG